MSADVDQEIYDDCSTLSTQKPPVMPRPVNDLAAMFEVKVGASNSQKNFGPAAKKPVAVVNPSKPGPLVNASKTGSMKFPATPSKPGPVVSNSKPGPAKFPATPNSKPGTGVGASKPGSVKSAEKPLPKPAVKPAVNGVVNGQNNNNNIISAPEKRPPSKISIPGAFNKPDEESTSKTTDFRSMLKPTGGINSTKGSMKTLTPGKSPPSPTVITNSSSKHPSNTPATTTSPPQKRISVLLSCDNVKFKKRHKPIVTGKPPKKPSKMPEVDFSEVKMPAPEVSRRAPPKISPNSSADGSFINGQEDYDDISNTETNRVSAIKEYTEDEELEDISGETYDDIGVSPPPTLPSRSLTSRSTPSTMSPTTGSLSSSFSSKSPSSNSYSVSEGETYDDCQAGGDAIIGEMDDVYEDVGEVQKNAALIAKKEEENRKEQERKEKKEREKREKEEKEKQRKLEKEKEKEKKMLTKYNMSGNETTIAEGKAKENAKGNKLDLALKKGDNLYIIRMTDNPQFKWLAKTPEGKVGYVESQNIEVDTSGIRNIMKENIKNDTLRAANSGVFDEVYDDVATVDNADQDIYEESG